MRWRIVFATACPDAYGKIDPLTILGVLDINAEDAGAALRQVLGYHAIKDARYVGLYAA